MTKEEFIEELNKIHHMCLDTDCENCNFSYGDYLTCAFLNTPHRWNIREIKRNIQGGFDDGKN